VDEHIVTPGEEAKFIAEARAANALAVRYEAETAKLLHEANEAESTARSRGYSADIIKMELEKQQHSERARRSADIFQHRYVFDSEFSLLYVNQCLDILKFWERNDDTPGAIEIVFVSPGGEITSGMYLFDYIQKMRRNGYTVTTVAYGMAASIAGILLQAGDNRVMTREAVLLIHEVATWTGGKAGEVEDDMERIKKWQDRIVNIFVERSGGKINAAEFKRKWRRRDWWLTSDEALELGLIDEVW
jgi:ATP-dependent Clp endopeptidase proteolytic subunit ClpP